MKHFVLKAAAGFLAAAVLSTDAMAWKKYPDATDDGLDRVKSKKVDALYLKEGANFDEYQRIRIEPVTVAFRKNWMRDQNRDRLGVSNRIQTEDMERIQAGLAELFMEEFGEVLIEGGYNVVPENGPDVLLLKPQIVDLDVTAPDISMRQPSMSRTYTTSSGEMTLHMDFVDSETNALIGRVIDRREQNAAGRIQYSNAISNRADAEQIVRSWANTLVKGLDHARESQ